MRLLFNLSALILLVFMSVIIFPIQNQTNDSTLSWFTSKKISERIWCISDQGQDNIYLVTGNKKALLIDNGTGSGNLLKFVKTITSLPIVMVVTHGHPDHCGGNFQFDSVYVHPNDIELTHFFCNETYHKANLENVRKSKPELSNLLVSDNFKNSVLLDVKEGYVFDLGNVQLEVVETPGHTKGSICLLDKESRYLFTGDNNNTLVWLFLQGCLPIEEYKETLEKQNKMIDKFDTILPGHGDPIEKSFIADQIKCSEEILNGNCKGEDYKTFAGNGKLCTYGKASIAFNPENLFKKKE